MNFRVSKGKRLVWAHRAQTTFLSHALLAPSIQHDSCAKPKGVREELLLRQARVLAPTIIQLLKYRLLLVRHNAHQRLAMPRHVAEKLFHFLCVSPIALLSAYTIPRPKP